VVKVNRFQQSAIAISLAIAVGAFMAPTLRAQGGPARPQFQGDYAFNATADCAHSASANCRRKPQSAAPAETGSSTIRIHGDAAAMRLDARHVPIADVFAALKTNYDVSYTSWTVLDDDINGTYSGSLRRVIARLLDGYNYVIKQNDGKLDVTILDRRGARAVPSATLTSAPPKLVDPFHPLRERQRQKLLRTDHP
jgi:hypothetical protein